MIATMIALENKKMQIVYICLLFSSEIRNHVSLKYPAKHESFESILLIQVISEGSSVTHNTETILMESIYWQDQFDGRKTKIILVHSNPTFEATPDIRFVFFFRNGTKC